MCYIYNEIPASHKKEWHNTICGNADKPRDYHSKWGKSDKDRQVSDDIAYMWNLKKKLQIIYLQKRNRPTDIENKRMVTKWKQGRERLGVWDEQIHTILYKTDKQQGLTD